MYLLLKNRYLLAACAKLGCALGLLKTNSV
jgi:hypothetical protein